MKNVEEGPIENFDPVPTFEHGVWKERSKFSTGKEITLTSCVQGFNRAKYFYYRSSKDISRSEDENSLPSAVDITLLPEPIEQESAQPATVCVGTQTDYREGECQTDPWDPPYKLKRGAADDLEILNLTTYTYGKGLPVGEEELKEIVRNREKRQFDALLPPAPTDENEYKKWRKLFEEQKLKEADLVKLKIKEYHDERLTIKESALIQDADERNERKNKILDRMWAKKKAELSEKIFKLREQFSRKLQRLDRKCLASRKKLGAHVGSLDSKAFMKKAVSDSALCQARESESSEPKDFYLDTARGLVELERWLWEEQKIVMEPEIYLPKKDSHPTRLQRIMEQAEKAILERKARRPVSSKTEKPYILEKKKSRPVTPTIPAIPQEVLDRAHAATVLQKTLKARALQKELIEIHNKYIGLIKEMHKTQAGLAHEQAAMDERKKSRFQEYLELRNLIREKCTHEEILTRFEGRAVSNVLSVMSHTIQRYEEWRDIDKYVMKAKDERRRREAEEAGQRQKEIQNKDILELVISKAQQEQKTVIQELLGKIVSEVEEREVKGHAIDGERKVIIKELLEEIMSEVEGREVKSHVIDVEQKDIIKELLGEIITKVEESESKGSGI